MAKKTNSEIQIDTNRLYPVDEAAELIGKLSTSKFVGSVDIDILLDLSEKQKKEVVTGNLVMPHRVGSDVRIAVIAEGEDQSKAKAAGADKVGMQELIKEIDSGTIDFDILIATPNVMRHMAKLGKVLGPRGLMPSPKNETVTADVEKSIKSYKAGKISFKSSEQHTIRTRVGKVDMQPEQIAENIKAFVQVAFEDAKRLNPQPFKKITISPTMGKGIKLDIASILSE